MPSWRTARSASSSLPPTKPEVRRHAKAHGRAAEEVVGEDVRANFEADMMSEDLTPPPAVMEETRRRQQDGPEVDVPLDEAFGQIRERLAEKRLNHARHA